MSNPIYYKPNSTIWLFEGMPLDKTNIDTFWFASKSDQNAFFNSKKSQEFTNVQFLRVNTQLPSSGQGNTATPRKANTVRIPVDAAQIYTVNYIAFQNKGFGTNGKWFYAFVNKINPISSNCCEIEYEIDSFQTWFFDCTVKESFVVREHIKQEEDTIGANIEPEPVDVPEQNYYKLTDNSVITNQLRLYALVVSNPDGKSSALGTAPLPNGDKPRGVSYRTIAMGESVFTPTDIISFVNPYLDKNNASGILDIRICLSENNEESGGTINALKNNLGYGAPGTITADIQNKKCFTGQFSHLVLMGTGGEEYIYYREFFSSDIQFTVAQGNELGMYLFKPVGYLNSHKYWGYYDSNVSVAFGGSTYNAMIVANALSVIPTIPSLVAGAAINPASGAMSILNTGVGVAQNAIASGYKRGRTSGREGEKNFVGFFYGKSRDYRPEVHLFSVAPPKQAMLRIDSFFTRFGYATNQYKIPNGLSEDTQRADLGFNYIQLSTPEITGKVPSIDMAEIKKIFERGVRLWNNTNALYGG